MAFDSWFTQPGFCQYLDQTLNWPYVGALATDERVILKRGTESVAQFADELKQEHLTALARTGTAQVFRPIRIHFKGRLEYFYSYCETHRLKNFGRLRLAINHREADLSDPPVCLIANRLSWRATGITRIYRHRWPVEVYHEEGKAEGLDQYQLRDFRAVERHVALVAVVYSLLRAAQHDPVLHGKLQRQLKLQLDASERRSAGFAHVPAAGGVGRCVATGHASAKSMGPRRVHCRWLKSGPEFACGDDPAAPGRLRHLSGSRARLIAEAYPTDVRGTLTREYRTVRCCS